MNMGHNKDSMLCDHTFHGRVFLLSLLPIDRADYSHRQWDRTSVHQAFSNHQACHLLAGPSSQYRPAEIGQCLFPGFRDDSPDDREEAEQIIVVDEPEELVSRAG